MEGLPKINQENNIEKPKIKEGVNFVFEQNPELTKIGTKEQYSKYLDTIFPKSKIKDIVYHGGIKHDFKDEGFKKIKDSNLSRGKNFHEFYGIYFGDFYSQYLNKNTKSYPVILNIKNIKIINHNVEKNLSSLNVFKGLKEEYNLTNEDAVLEIGVEHVNEYISKEDFKKHEKDVFEKYAKYYGVTFDELYNNTDENILSYNNILKYLDENGVTSLGISELAVFEPDQIWILGSQGDLENFKKFVENNQDSQS